MDPKTELPANAVSEETDVTEIEITDLEVREEFRMTCCGLGCNC